MAFGDSMGGPYSVVEIELSEMERYLGLMHSYLGEAQQKFNAMVDAHEKEARKDALDPQDPYYDDYWESFYEGYRAEYQELNTDFPRRLFYGFIINLYTLIEDQLFRVCRLLHIDVDSYIGGGGPCRGDKGITLAACAILQATQHNIETTNEWKEVKKLAKIRNQIAHANGVIPFSRNRTENNPDLLNEKIVSQAQKQYLDQHSLLQIERIGGRISPSFAYCQYILDLARNFLQLVYVQTGLKKT